MKKPKYFLNGFSWIYRTFDKSNKYYTYEYAFPKPQRLDWITNYLLIKKLMRTHKLEQYDVVHINNWEGIIAYKKQNPNQIFIAEAHGFFVGVNFDCTIAELPFVRRQLSKILKFFLNGLMQRRLKKADLFYVSTPNMLEHAKKIRKDAIWLPNPLDTKIFSSKVGKVKLEGNPVVFFPTRLHTFKNPLFGVNLFKKIKAKYPEAKLHMIKYGQGADPLFNAFQKIVDEKDVIYHDKMPHDELLKHYRGADLVLGQFNPNLGNLSLVELEAMACGAPIVTLDMYEIKNELSSLSKLEDLAFRLIKDKKFKNQFVKRNLEYVYKTHSEKAVIEANRKNIQKLIDNRKQSE
jgi:glycosyltransferase involved in cell wall biosynthesis